MYHCLQPITFSYLLTSLKSLSEKVYQWPPWHKMQCLILSPCRYSCGIFNVVNSVSGHTLFLESPSLVVSFLLLFLLIFLLGMYTLCQAQCLVTKFWPSYAILPFIIDFHIIYLGKGVNKYFDVGMACQRPQRHRPNGHSHYPYGPDSRGVGKALPKDPRKRDDWSVCVKTSNCSLFPWLFTAYIPRL